MSTKTDEDESEAKYEFRVWGNHPKARRKLARLADAESSQEFEDCYLLVADHRWNAKVRDETLKVKRLVARERGFDRWDSSWHTEAETAPSPFDDIFDDLSLDRPQRGKGYDLAKAVDQLKGDQLSQVVFVAKSRTRYRVGSVRAEVVDIKVKDSKLRLRSLAIQGDDLNELVALRRKLGLKGQANKAIHVVLEDELLSKAG